MNVYIAHINGRNIGTFTAKNMARAIYLAEEMWSAIARGEEIITFHIDRAVKA
jgi:hypothetical protein